MLDFELIAHLRHHFIIQIGGIVCNDFTWQPISAYQLFLDKFEYNFSGHTSI
ncbi:hypothetical protein Lalb_Chr23g0273911 [Lupinus albus]|uniref:Uncharacterized protein n=1 Tax=Lupinus albus TaxID=3870 RepID=A0A6A4N9D5_LUPAL|nr:hypothetical protein Lalb_Chr23g0273911 [Lupinus albus]